MGLDVSHNCFSGAYSSFMRFRLALGMAAGLGDLHDYEGYGGSKPWPAAEDEPLVVLLNHSDCDGELELPALLPLAARLEQLAPSLQSDPTGFNDHRSRAERFARGLHVAALAGENVEFH